MTPFPEADLTCDGFLGGRLRIWQPRRGFRSAADAVLLAAACPARPGETVLELGCGSGVALLCLGARIPGLALTGLERQPGYADLARRNATVNGIPAEIVTGDLAEMPATLRRSFDQVLANPPYLSPGGGTGAGDAGREAALRETTPLRVWVAAARRRLRPGGWLTLVQRADRLPDVLTALAEGYGSVAVLPVAGRTARPAGRVIVRARKGGRGAFRLLAPLILHEGATHDRDRDSHPPEVQAILRDGAPINAFD
ncbi:MAG: tRNA1(Val) (adenine(37)-N6)-methyltransferase [Gemmobacter sp.]